MNAGRITPLGCRRETSVCCRPPRQLTEFTNHRKEPLPERFAIPWLSEDGDGDAEFFRDQFIQVTSTDEIIHVPKLFNPSFDRTDEPFADLATCTNLVNLRRFRHQPPVSQTNCERRRCV